MATLKQKRAIKKLVVLAEKTGDKEGIDGNALEKAIKVATAKALKNLDYKLTEIAEVLGISERTAFTYVHETTNEKLQEFCDQFERLLLVTEIEGHISCR